MEHHGLGFQGRYAFAVVVRGIHPLIYRDFWRIFEALGTREERATIERVYEKLQPVNFSKQILERIAVEHPESISVLPVREVFGATWVPESGCCEFFGESINQGDSFKLRPHHTLVSGR
jgi:hypothetical protein